MGTKRSGERWIYRDLLADVRRADLVELEPAVRGGDLQPCEVERRRLAQQLARERPVVRVERLLARQHLVAHELGRGLAEHPLLLGKVLADEDLLGTRRLCEKLPATERVMQRMRSSAAPC